MIERRIGLLLLSVCLNLSLMFIMIVMTSIISQDINWSWAFAIGMLIGDTILIVYYSCTRFMIMFCSLFMFGSHVCFSVLGVVAIPNPVWVKWYVCVTLVGFIFIYLDRINIYLQEQFANMQRSTSNLSANLDSVEFSVTPLSDNSVNSYN